MLNTAAVGRELQRRLPRLLFAAYDRWPLAGGLSAGDDSNTVAVVAVRCVPVNDRLDGSVADELNVLVAGQVVQNQPRLLDFVLPGGGGGHQTPVGHEGVRLLVCWHDVLDFVALLQRGNAALIEALVSIERPLFESEEFSEFRSSVGMDALESLLKSKRYLMACAGPAMSMVRPPKKPKSDDDVAVVNDCNALEALCRRVATNVDADQLPTIEALVRQGEFKKKEWCPVVEALFDKASKAMEAKSELNVSAIEAWVDRLRDQDFEDFSDAYGGGAKEMNAEQRLLGESMALDAEWKNRLEAKWPVGAQLVFMTQTGSFMYNVQMPSSDSDFSIIFMSPTKDLCKREKPASLFQYHAHASFGSDKRGEIEYTGRELGAFIVDLAKGNPRNVEMLFCSKPALTSPVWRELQDMRRVFLTTRCAQQYLGFILDRLKNAQRACDDAKKSGYCESFGNVVSKLFYHAYHKIFELTRVLDGGEPAVGLVGEEREFVMKLRRDPPRSLDEALSRVDEIQKRWDELRGQLSEIEKMGKMPREVDVGMLTTWLRGVRTRQIAESSLQDSTHTLDPPLLRRTTTPSDKEAIEALLDKIEEKEQVRIIHAGYGACSHAWGTSGEGSDHDVKFIFAHRRSEYLGFRQPSMTLKFTYPSSGRLGEVRFFGWEAREVCHYLVDNDSSILQLLHCTTVFKTNAWVCKLQALSMKHLNRAKLFEEWMRNGQDCFLEHIQATMMPIRKKYVHVLRYVLCSFWLHHHKWSSSEDSRNSWPADDLLELSQQLAGMGVVSALELESIVSLASNREHLQCALARDADIDALIERIFRELETVKISPRGLAARDEREREWNVLCVGLLEDVSAF